MKTILVLVVCLFPISCMARAFEDQEVDLLPITPALEASAAKALQGCVPSNGKTVGGINKNGVYTLTGDLFHDNKMYTVVDDNEDVLLCGLQKSAWILISAVNVHTVWNFPSGYREPIVERSSDDQSQPFWMLDLEGHPLLAIASYVAKEGQYYYVLLFDSSRKRLLDWDSSFGKLPEVKAGYLLTGDSSRVKADWDATYYSKIKNDKLVVLKSWEDSVPWHAEDHEGEPDDTSNYASSSDKGYLILPDNSKSAHPADYIVVRSDPKGKRPEVPLPNDLGGRPYAAVHLTPSKDFQGANGLVYLFERLTQLPKELCPRGVLNESDIIAPPNTQLEVKVTGTDKELINLLSAPPHSDQK